MVTGRPGLDPGERGKPWVKATETGFSVATYLRMRNGPRKRVMASASTKSAALRKLDRKINELIDAGSDPDGVQPTWTVAKLGDVWLSHKARQGHARRRTPLKTQTVWNYSDQINRVIVPSLGALRLRELTPASIERRLRDLEETGISTEQCHTVFKMMLDLAVRDGALPFNPTLSVTRAPRTHKDVEVLDVAEARHLLEIVTPDYQRTPGKRGPNSDLADFVVMGLATGARISEILAITRRHVALDVDLPLVTISGTLVEPRSGYVEHLFRQESTKTNAIRTLVLPNAAVEVLQRRMSEPDLTYPDAPVFHSRTTGHFLWPANIRTRLRTATANDPQLGHITVTPHTLRRTVASEVAYNVGLEAARQQLGHSIARAGAIARYVAHRQQAPDLRHVLDAFFDTDR